MAAIEPNADTVEPVNPTEIQRNYMVFAQFLNYFIWLAKQDPNFKVTAGQIAQFFEQGVRNDRYWSEVASEIGLPEDPDW